MGLHMTRDMCGVEFRPGPTGRNIFGWDAFPGFRPLRRTPSRAIYGPSLREEMVSPCNSLWPRNGGNRLFRLVQEAGNAPCGAIFGGMFGAKWSRLGAFRDS